MRILSSLALLLSTTTSALDQALPSPSTSSDSLICHSSECYPRVFNPTPDFQLVHEDQQLPPGLHIRLNLQTGQREARLNIPLDKDGDDSNKGHDLAVVADITEETNEPNGETESRGSTKSMVEKSGQKPPAYSNHGRIMPPADEADSAVFRSSVALILSVSASPADEEHLRALEDLEELAHEMYYGVEIAKNTPLVRTLLRHAGNNADDEAIRALSILVLGSAVQNNPSALEKIQQGRPDMMDDVMRLLESGATTAKVQERLIFLLGHLVKGHGQRRRFVQLRGMERLLEMFDSENAGADGRDGVRRRCALFVTDTFLDEEMRTDPDEGETNVRRESGAQRVLSGEQTTKGNLKDWCKAFRISSDRLKKGESESLGARDRIDAALSFPACQM
ncbi:MAG: hypothetical protein M1816_006873 [Peltula sp. TS41687]|nr:MAG: hypothetical protein M1816_006873 [Peltula sp. TS41687]